MKIHKLPVVALLVAVASATLSISIASAHSRPVRFDPPEGAVLTAAPTQVVGWFTSDIRRDPSWSFIQVADSQGNRVDTGDANFDAKRRQMTVGLKPGVSPGIYTVTWRTWDDLDGAIFGDCYNFFVGQAAADAASTAQTRLDAGGKCARIDFEAKKGTPVAGVTPEAASATASEEMAQPATSNNGSKVALWVLAVGMVGCLGVGAVVGRFSSRRTK